MVLKTIITTVKESARLKLVEFFYEDLWAFKGHFSKHVHTSVSQFKFSLIFKYKLRQKCVYKLTVNNYVCMFDFTQNYKN